MQKNRKRGSNGVRIIAGEWRGRRITVPAGTSVRPTPDRVRETLFNWLAADIVGARCLDLFAGSGVLGLEALSRGARETWLIEQDPVLVRSMEADIERLGANAKAIQGNVLAVMRNPPPEPFDIVFADPPYDMNLAEVLGSLPSWVAPEGRVYVERPAETATDPLANLAASVPGAGILKCARAGRVTFGLVRLQK